MPIRVGDINSHSRCGGEMLGGSGGVGKLCGAKPHTTSQHHHCDRASHPTSRVGGYPPPLPYGYDTQFDFLGRAVMVNWRDRGRSGAARSMEHICHAESDFCHEEGLLS
eukprot:gene3545-biopygen1460